MSDKQICKPIVKNNGVSQTVDSVSVALIGYTLDNQPIRRCIINTTERWVPFQHSGDTFILADQSALDYNGYSDCTAVDMSPLAVAGALMSFHPTQEKDQICVVVLPMTRALSKLILKDA